MHTAVHVRIRYNMHKILQYANVTNGSISMQLPLLLKNWSKKTFTCAAEIGGNF